MSDDNGITMKEVMARMAAAAERGAVVGTSEDDMSDSMTTTDTLDPWVMKESAAVATKIVKLLVGNDWQIDQASPEAVDLIAQALTAAITRANEWRPIETAPKDGTAIWVTDGSRAEGASFTNDRWVKNTGTTIPWVGSDDYGGLEDLWDEPTHWQPLPTPPSGRE